MTVTGLIAGGLLVLAMVGVSICGWRMLPPDARVPMHAGPGGYNNYRSRNVALIGWPASGVLIFGIFCGIFVGALHPNHASAGSVLLILPLVILILIVAQVGAIRAAIRMNGRAGPGTRLG
jgi:hypothetical protein